MTGGYPEYKDSGVDWLGAIPAHWDTRRVKSLSPVKRGASPRPIGDSRYFSDNGEYGWVRIADVTASTKFLKRTKQKLSELGKSFSVPLEPGALFLSIAGSVGKPIIAGIKCCIHDGFVYFPYLRESEYLYYVFGSGAPYGGLGKFGTQLNLNTDTVGNIVIAFPPPDEQAAIVRFLDAAEARIRRYIRAKQKLIRLLNEQKQAIIQRAVTRGLDPDVPMKDSGVPWLGEIPAHWEDGRLKNITSHIVDCLHATPSYIPDGEYPAIRTADVSIGRVDYENARSLDFEQYKLWTARLVPREGDILYTREGERYGIAALVPRDAKLCISQRMMIFRVKPAYHSGYFMWQLNAPHLYIQASQDIGGATSPHVNIETIKNFWVLIPPIEEQEAINRFVSSELENIDRIIHLIKQDIDLIREYRTRLIADVVTGKIDVRGLAFELPETFDDSDLPDLDTDDLIEDDSPEDNADAD